MAPEERDRARRERLLEAGLQVFGTRGYASSSVAAVCAEAGVSRRSFYEHFEDREALLVAVFERIMTEVASAFDAALAVPAPDLATLCRRGIDASFRVLAEDERKARINGFEVPGVSPRVERHRRTAQAALAEVLDRHLAPFVAAGQVRRERLVWATPIFLGAFTTVLMVWLEMDPRPPVEEAVEELARTLAAALG